ncbi:MAG: GspH/FimT family pseudopilin [Acidobacteria bacterium]|nr:GspH/FimT family pseudopilin [Acidobacteriota bacterium]
MRDDRGFSLVEILAVVAVIGVIAAVATPLWRDTVDGMRLGSSTRELERQLQDARLKAVATNRKMRVRPNCPVTGQYRMVQVFGTTTAVDSRDVNVSRCDESLYPYDASNQNPVTKLQDGPVRRLYEGVTVTPETGVSAVEFWSDGRAFKVDSGGVRAAIATPITITLTRGSNTKRITVNGLGKIQIP